MTSMKLSQLITTQPTSNIPQDLADLDVQNVCADTRKLKAGDVFVYDSRIAGRIEEFVGQAIKAEAAAIVVDMEGFQKLQAAMQLKAIPHTHPMSIQAQWMRAQYPKQPKFMAGVTGTNGKTSVAWFARTLMEKIHGKAASIGTLGTYEGEEKLGYAGYTTPSAETLYSTLEGLADRKVDHCCMEVSSHALYHFLDLLVERGDLTPEAAAIRFENLRFLWRGDEVEENTLFKLANLYIQSKQYKNALERLKYLTVNFPESEYVPQAAAMMTKIFGDLFMDRRTDAELDPIGMLGLYYDFRELTPANEEGDRVVMNVANRLATLGLYDRAVETLERQLKFRANNPAAVGLLGLELAKLHFQNYSVGEGLEALNRTASKDLAPSLQNERKIMRAKLLGLAMKYEGALEVAKEATGTEAQDLQAEFAWELGEFKAVIDAMKPMFDAAGGSEWTGTDVTRFLRLATAQAALGQADDLQDLAIRYEQGIALHELTEQVDFLIQSARSESPAESRVEDELRTNPNEVPAGSSVWLRGEKGLEEQNDFNRDYRRTRQRWRLENEEADRSEMRGLQQEIQDRQNRFR